MRMCAADRSRERWPGAHQRATSGEPEDDDKGGRERALAAARQTPARSAEQRTRVIEEAGGLGQERTVTDAEQVHKYECSANLKPESSVQQLEEVGELRACERVQLGGELRPQLLVHGVGVGVGVRARLGRGGGRGRVAAERRDGRAEAQLALERRAGEAVGARGARERVGREEQLPVQDHRETHVADDRVAELRDELQERHGAGRLARESAACGARALHVARRAAAAAGSGRLRARGGRGARL